MCGHDPVPGVRLRVSAGARPRGPVWPAHSGSPWQSWPEMRAQGSDFDESRSSRGGAVRSIFSGSRAGFVEPRQTRPDTPKKSFAADVHAGSFSSRQRPRLERACPAKTPARLPAAHAPRRQPRAATSSQHAMDDRPCMRPRGVPHHMCRTNGAMRDPTSPRTPTAHPHGRARNAGGPARHDRPSASRPNIGRPR